MAVVPDALLVPPDAYDRHFDRGDGALLIDGYLRRLAAQESGGRLILGRLAATFLRAAAHHTLGFARLDDYAKERLGISGRELQSLATTTKRLDALPAIAAAFARGELSWAHVRLLVGVATPETEADWLSRARGRTVRALEALVGETRPSRGDEEEPRVRFHIRCPRRLVAVWRETVELARRMAGAPLSQGDAAEAIAAEGLSARPSETGASPMPPLSRPDPEETHAAFPPDLDWAAVTQAVPEDVAHLADGADSLDAFTLDARMRAVLAAMHRADWQIGRLLRVFLDRRLHQLMGFTSTSRYLRERLGMSERKARALVALERKTWEAPAFDAAYRAGKLSWVRALAILPLVSERSAAAWVARAGAVTVRRLLDEVEWALAAWVPCDPIDPPPLGADLSVRQMCARDELEYPDAEIAFTAPAAVVGLFRAAILSFAGPAEAPWRGLERLLAHVKSEWEAQPRHRDPVFARDGWRCAVPACSARRNLHDHHLLYRSRGGDNARENRITICAWHHLRGIHGGRVRAWGAAPDAVRWEVGLRPGGPPLLRFEGDRYAT